jgi:hypothetical protein
VERWRRASWTVRREAGDTGIAIPPATGSSNDYPRDTDPGLLQAWQIIGEFNTWSAERLPELYAAGYVGGPTTTCG